MKKKLIITVMFMALLVPLISAEKCLAETYVDDTVNIPSGYVYTVSFTVNEDSTDLTISIDVKSGPSVSVVLSGHISSTVSSSKDFDVTLNAGDYILGVANFGSGTATVKVKISSGFGYWGIVIIIALVVIVLVIRNKMKSSKRKEQYQQSLGASRSQEIYGSAGSAASPPLSQPDASTTMFCHGCGGELSSTTKFCSACGTEQ